MSSYTLRGETCTFSLWCNTEKLRSCPISTVRNWILWLYTLQMSHLLHLHLQRSVQGKFAFANLHLEHWALQEHLKRSSQKFSASSRHFWECKPDGNPTTILFSSSQTYQGMGRSASVAYADRFIAFKHASEWFPFLGLWIINEFENLGNWGGFPGKQNLRVTCPNGQLEFKCVSNPVANVNAQRKVVKCCHSFSC